MSIWRVAAMIAAIALNLPIIAAPALDEANPERVINFVVIPDAHTYTESLRFVPQIIDRVNALDIQPDFVMSLGDNVSGGEDHDVLGDANRYHRAIARLNAPHFYTIGNHECIPVEVYKLLTWEQLLDAWEMDSRWYSFDAHGVHVCVLDAWASLATDQFEDDFQRECEWLLQDLAGTSGPTIVFVHEAIGFQREDCKHWIETDNRKFWPPGNFFETTIEANAAKVLGVFEGHKHKSLHETRGGVTYHQLGASHAHGGQFAQVFLDPNSGAYFVQAHPQAPEQDAEQTIQATYGDPAVVGKLRAQLAAAQAK